jgi:hypothetical protein
VWLTVWKLLKDLVATLIAVKATGAPIGLPVLGNLVELFLIGKYIRPLTFYEAVIFEIFEEELFMVGADTVEFAVEDEDDRSAEASVLARQHPGTETLYGEVTEYDLALLAISGFETFRAGIPQAAFEVARTTRATARLVARAAL